MEGVGARLGRSSSRYGTTTVFNGPVRKWKKDWVPINPPSSSSSSSSSNNSHHHHHHGNGSVVNGGNSVSHLRLYKWTPHNNNNKVSNNTKTDNNNSNNNSNDNGNKVLADNDVVSEEEVPKRKKFKYIPVAVLEERKNETEDNSENDEAKPTEGDEDGGDQPSKSDANDDKPDINDMPMEDNQAEEDNRSAPARQDLNELDLSLG